MPPATPPDFSRVGEAFTSAVQYIRTMGVDNLDDAAIAWFKTACEALMRSLQKELCALQNMTQQLSPTHYPVYVVDPGKPLFLGAPDVPPILVQYIPQFKELFVVLFQRCGFKPDDFHVWSTSFGSISHVYVEIFFPVHQNTGTKKPPKKLDMGNFFDSFSSLETLAKGVSQLRIKDASAAEDDDDEIKNEEDEDDNTKPSSAKPGPRRSGRNKR